VRGETLTRELELTYGEGHDHAEGIGLIGSPDDGSHQLRPKVVLPARDAASFRN
jgi:hypothetical protein